VHLVKRVENSHIQYYLDIFVTSAVEVTILVLCEYSV